MLQLGMDRDLGMLQLGMDRKVGQEVAVAR